MDSNQTLHDFVLNLITNPEARSAFQLDPEGTLNQAGLGDITAADVQDVVPLVVDYAAVPGGTGGIAPVVAEPDLGALDTGPTDVIGQLQAVTQRLAAQPTSVEGNVAATGAVAFDAATFGIAVNTPAGIGVAADPTGVSADLTGAYDVAGTLDSGVVDQVTSEPTGVLDATSAIDGATGQTGFGATDGLIDGVLGNGLTSQLDDPLSLVDSLGVTDQAPVSVPELGLDEGGSPVGGATGAVDETLDSVGGGLLGGGAGASGEAEVPGGTSAGLLDDATNILF